MKYINIKTITIIFSTVALMAITGCGSTGTPSDDTLVGDAVGQLPVAQAGPDRTIVEGTDFTLDGKDSYDPDGEIVSYVWSAEGITKEGITVDFDAVPYRVEPYSVTLTVTDDDGNINSDIVEITVVQATGNLPPNAEAIILPKNQYDCSSDVDYYDTNISLDASTSSDPDGQIVSYAWSGTMQGVESVKSSINNKDSMNASIPVQDLCERCKEYGTDAYWEPLTCGVSFIVSVTDDGGLSNDDLKTIEITWPNDGPY